MSDQEPDPEYAWDMKNPYGYQFKIIDGKCYYQHPDDWVFRYNELTDEIMQSWGCTWHETPESRIARLEWRVRQLEQEPERRLDYETEMQERLD